MALAQLPSRPVPPSPSGLAVGVPATQLMSPTAASSLTTVQLLPTHVVAVIAPPPIHAPVTKISSALSGLPPAAGLDCDSEKDKGKADNKKSGVYVLGFDLLLCSPATQLVALSIGIFAFFLLNGYIEEYLFRALPNFKFGWYLVRCRRSGGHLVHV